MASRGKRALRQGPARWAAGVVVEPRDVGTDRQEIAVEAALVRLRTVRLRDQRIAINKRAWDRAYADYKRLMALHMVQAHGVTRTKEYGEVAYVVPGVERPVWESALDDHHERLHGR